MKIWSWVMSWFGRRRSEADHCTSLLAEQQVNDRVNRAMELHKEVTQKMVQRSLDQVQRGADSSFVIKGVLDRLDMAAAQTALDAADLISRGHDDPHP